MQNDYKEVCFNKYCKSCKYEILLITATLVMGAWTNRK